MAVALELGFPFSLLLSLGEYAKKYFGVDFEQRLKEVISEARDYVIVVPLLDPSPVELPEYFPREKVVIAVEPHSGLRVFPTGVQQVDSELDSAGAFCPLRGRSFLKSLVSKLAKECGGVLLDLTDFYAFSSRRGYFSCACNECMRAYERELEEVIEEHERELRGVNLGDISPQIVLEKVRGGALKSLVKREEEAVYSCYEYKSLRQLLTAAKDREAAELAAAFLFLRARSRVCAKAVSEIFEGGSGLRAVAVEDDKDRVIGCSAEAFLQVSDVDEVWVGFTSFDLGRRIRYYNLPRGRYIIGQLDEKLYVLARAFEMEWSLEEVKQSLESLKRVWNQAKVILANSWIPSEPPLGGNYAIYGWPKHLFSLSRDLIEFTIERIVYLLKVKRQEREAKLDWNHYRQLII